MSAVANLPRAERRRLSGKIMRYLGKQYLLWFVALFGLLVAVVTLATIVEMLDRLANKQAATLGLVVELALLRVPQLSQEVLPFAALGAGMGLFWRLTRTHELVVTRAAGVSIWQFLLPPLAVAVAIGILAFAVLNPIAATLVKRYVQLEAEVLRNQTSIITVSKTGLWLRQVEGDQVHVLHAEKVSGDGATLERVMVLRFDGQDHFVGRLDAERAVLGDGNWRLEQVWESAPGTTPKKLEQALIATEMTPERLNDNFAPPETVSFWQIPSYVEVLEAAGFPTERLKLQFHRLLAMPLLFSAMVIIAATFAMRPPRRGGVTFIIGLGVVVGFLLYFLSNFVFALGLSGKLPLILAAWTPTTVCLMLGVTVLLHLEDG